MEKITTNISNEFRIGVKEGIQQEQKRIIEIIDKQIFYFSKPETTLCKAQVYYLQGLKQQIQEEKEQ